MPLKIIVVGAGVYGLSTTLALLNETDHEVHLIDKTDYEEKKYSYFSGCDSASSDMNKIFRAAYGDKVHYQKMALDSREVFLKWNKQIKEEGWEGGDPVYVNTGNIHLTDLKELPEFERDTLVKLGDEAVDVNDLFAEKKAQQKGLDPMSVKPFGERPELQGILDTTGGIMVADKCCRWVLELCKRAGGDRLHLHLGEQVDTLLFEGKKCTGVKLVSGEEHLGDKVAVFAGAWLPQLVPEAAERVEATGGTVAICKVKEGLEEKFDMKKFPSWTYKMRDGAMGGLYGFPVTQGYLKIGYRGLKWTNPQDGISKVKTAYTDEKETNVPLFGLLRIKLFIERFLPEVETIVKTRLCWYSDSADNDFLIDYCPYYEDKSLFVGAGDSGHAFMMFGSLGTVIKDIMLGEGDKQLTELFSWSRDREILNEIGLGLMDPRALQNLKMATPEDWKLYK